jgi:acyl-CoA synthetase (AMP-forming)/AMP-acid ligase II
MWRRWLAISAVSAALIAGIIVAELNPPSPTRGKRQQEHETYSAQKHRAAQAAQHSRADAPTVVQAQQPQNQHAIAAQSKHQGEWYAIQTGG